LVAAVALAMSAGTALAAPPAGALPGMGVLIAVDVPATTTLSSPGGLYCMGTAPVCGAAATVGQQIWNGATFPLFPTLVPSIVLNSAAAGGRAVIQWGGNTYNALTGPNAETANAAGFNVGKSATLVFTANQANGAILNIDNSGSPSEIFGQLVANDLAGFTPSLYVANTNGIIVGPNATIAVPQGIGLIGASMTGATAIFDFVRNNGTAQSFIDVTTGQAKVEVNGSITGDLLNAAPVFNQPASFVLLAGGDKRTQDTDIERAIALSRDWKE
jgi:filamentous hemagglutinin family protein